MANGFSCLFVGNNCHAHKCVCVCVRVGKRVFFERIIWMSNHCANWKYIFMVDKSGVDQGASSRCRQVLAVVFHFMRPPVRCLRGSEGDGLISKAILGALGIVL